MSSTRYSKQFLDDFGKWVKESRSQKGLTQESFAKAIGYSVQTLRKIETGRYESVDENHIRIIKAELAEFADLAPAESAEDQSQHSGQRGMLGGEQGDLVVTQQATTPIGWGGQHRMYVFLAIVLLLLGGGWFYNPFRSSPTNTSTTPIVAVSDEKTQTDMSIPPTLLPNAIAPTPLPCPTPANPECMVWIEDITIRDGARIPPGMTFDKQWRVRNIGTSAWDKDVGYIIVRDRQQYSALWNAPETFPVPLTQPGDEAIFTTPMTAPIEPGRYRAWYLLRGPEDQVGTIYVDFTVDPSVTVITEPPK